MLTNLPAVLTSGFSGESHADFENYIRESGWALPGMTPKTRRAPRE